MSENISLFHKQSPGLRVARARNLLETISDKLIIHYFSQLFVFYIKATFFFLFKKEGKPGLVINIFNSI